MFLTPPSDRRRADAAGARARKMIVGIAGVLAIAAGGLCVKAPRSVYVHARLAGPMRLVHAEATADCMPRVLVPPFNTDISWWGGNPAKGMTTFPRVTVSNEGHAFDVVLRDRVLSIGKYECFSADVKLRLEGPDRCLDWVVHIARNERPGPVSPTLHPEAQETTAHGNCPVGHSILWVADGGGQFNAVLEPTSVRPGVTYWEMEHERP